MTFYLSGAGAYCLYLLLSKFSDRECSKTDPRSWLILTIASALWMVVVPISLIELTIKAKTKHRPIKPDSKAVEENSLHIETIPVR